MVICKLACNIFWEVREQFICCVALVVPDFFENLMRWGKSQQVVVGNDPRLYDEVHNL